MSRKFNKYESKVEFPTIAEKKFIRQSVVKSEAKKLRISIEDVEKNYAHHIDSLVNERYEELLRKYRNDVLRLRDKFKCDAMHTIGFTTANGFTEAQIQRIWNKVWNDKRYGGFEVVYNELLELFELFKR